jgi:hypothetical protein
MNIWLNWRMRLAQFYFVSIMIAISAAILFVSDLFRFIVILYNFIAPVTIP